MAGFAKSEIRFAQPSAWFDQIAAIARSGACAELAKTPKCPSHDHDRYHRRGADASTTLIIGWVLTSCGCW